jgi:hypothetical protein
MGFGVKDAVGQPMRPGSQAVRAGFKDENFRRSGGFKARFGKEETHRYGSVVYGNERLEGVYVGGEIRDGGCQGRAARGQPQR